MNAHDYPSRFRHPGIFILLVNAASHNSLLLLIPTYNHYCPAGSVPQISSRESLEAAREFLHH